MITTYNSLFSPENVRDTLQVIYDMRIVKQPVRVIEATVEEPELSFYEAASLHRPYDYKIYYKLQLGDIDIFAEDTIAIPKMYNHMFLVRAENGYDYCFRSPINHAKVDRPIAIFNTSVYISKALTVENLFNLKKQTELVFGGNRILLATYSNYFGLDLNPNMFGEAEADEEEDLSDFANGIVCFDKRVATIFNYYFHRDLRSTTVNEQPAWLLLPNDIKDIIELCFTKREFVDIPSIFDYRFLTTAESFLDHLKENTLMYDFVRNRYYRSKGSNEYGSLKTDYAQDFVNAYFRMQSKVANNLQELANTNPVDILGQAKKIFFMKAGNRSVINYTQDFLGIIDPVETHEGPNTSIKNALARDCTVRDGEVFVTVLNKEGNLVELSAIDHYNSRILSTTSYDYENKKLLLNTDGKIKVLYRASFKSVDPNPENYDYLRPSPYSTFSYNSSMIPKINSVDSVRGAMSTAMTGQAIPVVGARPNIVSTGIEKLVYDEFHMNIFAEEDGEVINFYRDMINVMNKTGQAKTYIIPQPQITPAGTTLFFEPVVEVGEKIKKDQLLVKANCFQKNQLAVTVPLRIAYMSYFGYEFEDGMAISESAAELLAHKSREVIKIPIYEAPSYIFDKGELLTSTKFSAEEQVSMNELNDFGLPEPGHEVFAGEMLFAYLYEIDGDYDVNTKLLKQYSKDKLYQRNATKVPQHIRDGKVVDVRVFVKSRTKKSPLRPIFEEYDRRQQEQDETTQAFLGKYIPPMPEEASPVPEDCIGLITITIDYTNYIKEGDKLSNRFGSKGLVTKIVPDEEMPIQDDGKIIDVIISPYSVINRKNTAQLNEIYLGSASQLAWEINSQHIKKKEWEIVKQILNTLYVTNKFTMYTEEELIEFHQTFSGYYQIEVLPYDTKYTEEAFKKIEQILNLPLTCSQYLTVKGRRTRKPVIVGITSIERLHFIAEDKAKVTSRKPSAEDLILGMGVSKRVGQKIGTQEVSAILAHGVPDLLTELNRGKADHGRQILQQLWALGLDIVER